MPSPVPAAQPAPILLAAPHRAMFFVGAIVLVAGMLWWLGILSAWRMPAQALPSAWTHGLLMQYATLGPFVLGFLLTVFPRWMNLPAVPRRTYAAVFGLALGGAALLLASASGWPQALFPGLLCLLLGWLTALWTLGERLYRHACKDLWANSAWCALAWGAIGLGMAVCASLGAPVSWIPAANKVAVFGFLLPMYFTVAHRMVPFFSGNAIANYRVLRPRASLLAVWALSLAHLALDLSGAANWRWLADVPMTALLLWQWLAWQPWKARRPGLLLVLYWALAWLPLSFALYSADSIHGLLSHSASRALAPLHALTIGFFSSMLVAMVTRVTHGHSGRPLAMGPIPWFAFLGIQLAALVRVAAEYVAQPWPWYIAAAALWLLALLPWAVRALYIYLTPRRDGAPG